MVDLEELVLHLQDHLAELHLLVLMLALLVEAAGAQVEQQMGLVELEELVHQET
jgi:hypothetical protein